MTNKKVVVTGSTGFIGKRFVELLLNKNFKVLGIDPNETDIVHKNYEHHLGFASTLNDELIKNYFNTQTTVFHIGATKHRESSTDPKKIIHSNIIDLQNLLEICKKYHIKKLFFTSSLYVYGLKVSAPYKENSPTLPDSLYGMTKLIGENLIEEFTKDSKTSALVLRLFFVYGPGQRNKSSNYDSVIHKTIKNILSNKNIEIYGSGNQIMDFIYIDDLCDFFIENIDSTPNNKYTVTNFCSGEKVSVLKLVTSIKKLMDSNKKIVFTKPDWTNNTARYGSRVFFKKEFSYELKTDLEKGILNCLNDY